MPAIPPQFQQQFQQQQQQQQQQQPQQLSPFVSIPASQPTISAPAPAPVQKPQPTGFQEMAASFQTAAGRARPKPPEPSKKTNKIPNIRLSFITATDQAKFEQLFKSAVGDGQTTMSGEKARDLLLMSRLDGDSLSKIW